MEAPYAWFIRSSVGWSIGWSVTLLSKTYRYLRPNSHKELCNHAIIPSARGCIVSLMGLVLSRNTSMITIPPLPSSQFILTVLLIRHKGMIGTLSCIFSCTGNSLTIRSWSSLREVVVCSEGNLITSVKTGDVYFLLGNAANGKPSGDHGSCQQSYGRPKKGWWALFHGSSTQHLNTPMCMGTWVIITSSLKISPSCHHGIIITAEPAYSYKVYSRFLAIVELTLVPLAFISLLF